MIEPLECHHCYRYFTEKLDTEDYESILMHGMCRDCLIEFAGVYEGE